MEASKNKIQTQTAKIKDSNGIASKIIVTVIKLVKLVWEGIT